MVWMHHHVVASPLPAALFGVFAIEGCHKHALPARAVLGHSAENCTTPWAILEQKTIRIHSLELGSKSPCLSLPPCSVGVGDADTRALGLQHCEADTWKM